MRVGNPDDRAAVPGPFGLQRQPSWADSAQRPPLGAWCRACQQQRDADLQALIDAGRGDVPLRSLRWKCTRCGHRDIDMVVTSQDVGAAV
jgi:hypothetical protein